MVLENLENQVDILDAIQACEKAETYGTISLEQFKKQLQLKYAKLQN